jgi:predicted transcriptional regulator
MKHSDSSDRQTTWAVPAPYSTTGGRDRGKELRGAIVGAMQACPPDGVLLVDFSAVQTLDFSAADEVVGGLVGRVLSGDLGTRRFVLTGLGESARESIEAVLKLRKRHCLEVTSDRRVHVLGPISSAHEETLEFVAERAEVAVADVAERFWSEPNMTAATNRLNTLAGLGLVLRRVERGGPRGNRYVYAAVMAPQRRGSGKTKQ